MQPFRHSRLGGPKRDHMRIRRVLLAMVLEICERDGLGQHDIARMCATSRPRGWYLLNGYIDLFNSETLIDILYRLGVDVDVAIARRVPYLRWIPANPRPGWKPLPGARGTRDD